MPDYRYIAIDLKSFYASVECVERKLDPLDVNLVVADPTRTDKTICLAVSPALKACGISGRPRLFEVVQAVRAINAERKRRAPGHRFTGKSNSASALADDPGLELDYVVAPPRMALYMDYSTRIYRTYLKYVSAEDIHVYSCDEVFMDVSRYEGIYHKSAHELAMTMIKDVLTATGITATAGIGTNLFLCKVAMDIVAKRMPADSDGVRIAELDERTFRLELWDHKPLTDFWRVGRGTAARLSRLGLYTMGDVAEYSEVCEAALYKAFGVNAELLIDHAWGYEPCTIADIKAYRPESNSLSTGQVLERPYSFSEAAVIVREMTDLLALDLVAKGLVTRTVVLTLGYEHLTDPSSFEGELHSDMYGRVVPGHAHGTATLPERTASSRLMTDAVMELFNRIANRKLFVRRVGIAACDVIPESEAHKQESYEQLNIFSFTEDTKNTAAGCPSSAESEALSKEKAMQLATLEIKQKYGKNAILKGMNLLDGATTIKRNSQIGGHRA